MLTRALTGALVALGSLAATGCGDDTSAEGPTRVEASTVAEFFVEVDDGSFIFERVDRVTPEPFEATEGAPCFSDPGWASDGAPYDRGGSLLQLPTGTERGEVNAMGQCDLPGSS